MRRREFGTAIGATTVTLPEATPGRPAALLVQWSSGVALAACIAAPAFAAGTPQPPNVSVLVAKATNRCFVSAVQFTGLVTPRREAVINLQADGYVISEVLVSEGDLVSSGQALARATRLARSTAAPAAAAAPGGAIPEPPAGITLKAPTSGLLSRSTAKIGDVAAAVPLPPPFGPEPLFRIIVDNELEVEADVPSFNLPKLAVGQPAQIGLDNGHELNGKVRAILPEIDVKTQLGKVRLSIAADRALRAGMFAHGSIDASYSCGVAIPRAAVQYQAEGTTVQIVQGSIVETRHVRLGFFSEADIEVREGVKEGDLVIATAGSSLHDGDKVKPIVVGQTSE